MGILSKNNTYSDQDQVANFYFPTSKSALIIFTRNPELGKCKTRLAKTIGNASTIMKPFSKISKSAAELGESFSEEFAKNIGERSTKRIGFSYFEDLSNRRGNYLLDFDNIVAPLRKTGTLLPEDELAVIRILRGASPRGASKEVKKALRPDLLISFGNSTIS